MKAKSVERIFSFAGKIFLSLLFPFSFAYNQNVKDLVYIASQPMRIRFPARSAR